MSSADKANANRSAATPLPPKIAGLLRETGWIAMLLLALYLALILFTFDKGDPGWSRSVAVDRIGNAGGPFGARVADILLSSFGLSAWWWVVLCALGVRWSFRRIEKVEESDRRSLLVAGIGFGVLLLASCSLEAIRFWSLKAALPQAPGGIIGLGLGGFFARTVGFTGATLILLALIASGLSLFAGMSWVEAIERVGGAIEWSVQTARNRWQDRQDRKAGEVAMIRREEVVEVSKKKLEIHEPIRIAPSAKPIQKSPRVEREKQAPLFEHLPDSPLPPIINFFAPFLPHSSTTLSEKGSNHFLVNRD